MKKLWIIVPLAILILYALPASAKGLVPCGGPNETACTTCHLFELLKNVIDFITLRFMPIVAAALFVWAGLQMIISAGNSGKLEAAKGLLKNTIIAVGIILLAWLIVNSVLQVVAGDKDISKSWYKLECSVGGGATGGAAGDGSSSEGFGGGGFGGGGAGRSFGDTGGSGGSGSGGGGSGTTSGNTTGENEARSILASNGISVNKQPCPSGASTGCTDLDGIRKEAIDGATELKEDCNCNVVVTGGTEAGHASGIYSHTNGYKLDFRKDAGLNEYIRGEYDIEKNFSDPQSACGGAGGSWGGGSCRRSDGSQIYIDPESGAIYAEEHDHWDVNGWHANYEG
jgi:hypothetical protein